MSAEIRERISHSALRPVKMILIQFLFVPTLTSSPSTVPDTVYDHHVPLSFIFVDISQQLQAFLRNVTDSYSMSLGWWGWGVVTDNKLTPHLLRRFTRVTQNHLAGDISWLLCNSLPNSPCVSFSILDYYKDSNTYLQVLRGCTGFERWGSLPSLLPSPVWFTCRGNWWRSSVTSTDYHLMLYNHGTVALHIWK